MNTTSKRLSKKSMTSSMPYLGVLRGYALPHNQYVELDWAVGVGYRSLGSGSTERSVVEENDIMKCVSESLVVGPDFAHRRL